MKSIKWAVALCLLPSVAIAGLSSADHQSKFEKALASIMAMAAPQQTVGDRQAMMKRYLANNTNKALAVQLSKGAYWRSYRHDEASLAGERALEACQLHWGTPCALLAVNDAIVEGELISRDMPRLHYRGTFEVSQIPAIRSDMLTRPDVQSYDKAREPKAMAIHPWGLVFIAAGNRTAKEAQEAALTKCNDDPSRNKKDGGCYLYAIDNDVIIDERRMSAK